MNVELELVPCAGHDDDPARDWRIALTQQVAQAGQQLGGKYTATAEGLHTVIVLQCMEDTGG